MQENELNYLKLNFVNALATVIIAFVSLVGLIFALTEFIESRKNIFGLGWSAVIIIIFIFFLVLSVVMVKRWIEK